MTITFHHYLVLSFLLFAVGVTGVLVRRNALIVLMSVELMLNGANLALLGAARQLNDAAGHGLVTGVAFRVDDGGQRACAGDVAIPAWPWLRRKILVDRSHVHPPSGLCCFTDVCDSRSPTCTFSLCPRAPPSRLVYHTRAVSLCKFLNRVTGGHKNAN